MLMRAPAEISEPIAAPARRDRRLVRYAPFALPLIAILVFFYLWPLLRVALLSIGWPDMSGASYLRVVTSPAYTLVMANTIWIAAMVTGACLLLGYPVAFLLAGVSPPTARLLLPLVVVPFGTSLLVRNYAWMVLLGNNGVVNNALQALGLTDEPLPLLYNAFGVVVGMAHVLLPYMILVLYSSMRGIDRSLGLAAQSLGAGPLRAFFTVFVPLSLPAVAAGCALVFIMALGFFVTPALLGGRSGTMISMVIENQINQLVNWPMGAALSIALLLVTFVLLAVCLRLVGVRRLTRGVA